MVVMCRVMQRTYRPKAFRQGSETKKWQIEAKPALEGKIKLENQVSNISN
jgi:hypothetical protein